MTTQRIEVEGLPEGYRAIAFRPPVKGEDFLCEGTIFPCIEDLANPYMIVEKIQPRRIVLEEIPGSDQPGLVHKTSMNVLTDSELTILQIMDKSSWKQVKETDIPLTNDEPKLSLTKKDMLELIEHIKLGGQLNPKIAEFIKVNS